MDRTTAFAASGRCRVWWVVLGLALAGVCRAQPPWPAGEGQSVLAPGLADELAVASGALPLRALRERGLGWQIGLAVQPLRAQPASLSVALADRAVLAPQAPVWQAGAVRAPLRVGLTLRPGGGSGQALQGLMRVQLSADSRVQWRPRPGGLMVSYSSTW